MILLNLTLLNQVNVQSSVLHVPTLGEISQKVGKMHQNLSSMYCVSIEGSLHMLTLVPRWMYSLILTIDANFQLKLKSKGYVGEPALGDGWAYWVESEPYKHHMKMYGHQAEVCTFLKICSSLN